MSTLGITLAKLKLGMYSVMAIVIGLSTLILTALIYYLAPGVDAGLLIIGSLIFVVVVHVIQWMLGPKIIEMAYRVKPVAGGPYSWLNDLVRRVSLASGLKKVPKVMLANIEVPNAFAYGNVFSGYKVAVTKGLLDNLPREEVEAVVAHEIGHIKHRDVEVMMVISILPAIIYWLGQVLYRYGFFSGLTGRRNERASPAVLILLGIGLLAISFIFNLFVLYLSRLREYYADSHSAMTVSGGAWKLQRALARILITSGSLKLPPSKVGEVGKFKAFLIADPDLKLRTYGFSSIDEVVEYVKSRKSLLSLEIFSTHPDPAKRLRFLDRFRY